MYFVSIWESVKHHERFREIAMINQENDIAKRFIPLTQAMSAAGDKLIRYQLELVQGTAIPALESKNTEFVIITPKEGVSLERIREVGLDVHDVWDTNGHPIALWESVEGDRTFLIIVGWLSTTHHYDTVKNEPYASVVNAFSQVGNFNISHAHLEKNI
ncbi:hypothetical protein J3R30DRAFT_2116424 [Lentinula aciculospora]|uniref:Uncharacterized protein n=1 Tax=Lentinula aciculospora TaxID=153920 RepID=A0A9W9AGG2_9AGAR|nr:hypothetical protein J3R30DRAFT_2116424 [Lentinula aciculospora]